ncbi:MAG: hypothetical protein ABIL76_03230 [candidate division WOR-3 bacterium]
MITKNYLIEKSLKNGKKIREICKVYKCSPNKVMKIKREGFFKIDKLKELLFEIRENNPFFKLKDFQNYLKEKYNIITSLSKIHYKLKKKSIDDRTAKLIEMLIEDGKFDEIKKIVKFYKFESKYFHLLEKIPDNYLDEDNFVEKIIGLSENFKLTNEEKRIYLEKIDKMLESRKNKFSFYILLEAKIYLHSVLLEFDIVKQIYEKYIKEIEHLPKENRRNFYLSFANIQSQYPEIAIKALRKLKSFKIEDEALREVMNILLYNMGYVYKSKNYFDDIAYEFSTGNYKNYLKSIKNYNSVLRGNKIVIECNVAISQLFLGKLYNFETFTKKVENDINYMKSSSENLNVVKALKYAIDGDFENSKKILRSCKTKTLRAIGEGNFDNLSKYRKQELILKYLVKGNIKRAVEVARRYGNLYNLHLYSILLNKSVRHLSKYLEFKNVLKILKLRQLKFIGIYLLYRKPFLKVNSKKFNIAGAFRWIALLVYILLLGGKVGIGALRSEYISKNIKSLIYSINYRLGYRILKIKNNFIYVNCPFYLDLLEFMKNRNFPKPQKLLRRLKDKWTFLEYFGY